MRKAGKYFFSASAKLKAFLLVIFFTGLYQISIAQPFAEIAPIVGIPHNQFSKHQINTGKGISIGIIGGALWSKKSNSWAQRSMVHIHLGGFIDFLSFGSRTTFLTPGNQGFSFIRVKTENSALGAGFLTRITTSKKIFRPFIEGSIGARLFSSEENFQLYFGNPDIVESSKKEVLTSIPLSAGVALGFSVQVKNVAFYAKTGRIFGGIAKYIDLNNILISNNLPQYRIVNSYTDLLIPQVGIRFELDKSSSL